MAQRIVISCSIKYRELISQVMDLLEKEGLDPIFPNLEPEMGELTEKKKAEYARDHFNEIDRADAVYFILPKGYMGTSCKIELGYAVARNKTIYFSEKTGDVDLDCYANQVIPIQSLKNNLFI